MAHLRDAFFFYAQSVLAIGKAARLASTDVAEADKARKPRSAVLHQLLVCYGVGDGKFYLR